MANEKQVLTNCQRLIDPSVIIRDLTAMKSMYDAIALDGIIKALKEAPTVDAVEVVRCKDCKYQIKEWHPDNRMISKGYYTYGCDRNFHLYSSNAVNGHDNEFCSNGERRAGE